MYHPSRGGVRGGRDQFNWDDVKVDKHRENYLGHSVKAPVGRWQKGKDLTWYARDKKTAMNGDEETKAEIQRIKEEEEQAMREVLGLAPKRGKQFQGNRLDKHETAELLKRGKTEEDLVPDYAQGERIQGLGFAPAPRHYSSKVASLPNAEIIQRHEAVKHGVNDLPRDDESRGEEEGDPHTDEKMRRKLEKKEAKERRKEEKREAKKEKRKYSASTSSGHDKRHHDGKHSRRRHDSESSG